MVYSDPYIHLSVADSHINYDLPRMRGNETPSDWKDRIWDTLMGYRKNHLLTDYNKRYLIARKPTYLYTCDVWFGVNIGICYSCNQLVYFKLGSGMSISMHSLWISIGVQIVLEINIVI